MINKNFNIKSFAYLCLRKCRLNAKKARARVTPTLERQVTTRKAAGATVTTLKLRKLTFMKSEVDAFRVN